MAYLNLTGPEIPTWSPARFVRIFWKRLWADDWSLLEGARLDYGIWAVNPTMPRAQFSRRFGKKVDGGVDDLVYSNVYSPVDLSRAFILIEFPTQAIWEEYLGGNVVTGETLVQGPIPSFTEPVWRWMGLVDVQSQVLDASSDVNGIPIPQGVQTFLCYGLEALLDRHRIDRSIFKKPGDTENEILEANVGITFNDGGRGNRSKKKVTKTRGAYVVEHYVFEYHPNEFDANDNEWSTRDIVEYLINSEVGYPQSVRGSEEDEEEFEDNRFRVFLASSALDALPKWDAPEIETHLVSAWDLLNSLISRRRLNFYYLNPPTAFDKRIIMHIGTMTDQTITLPGNPDVEEEATIPQNTDDIGFTTTGHWSADVVVQSDTTHSVDQVICYGARRTNTRTLDFGNSTADQFKRGWTPAEQVVYERGGSDHANYPPASEIAARQAWSAYARSRENVAHVFKRFQLNHLLQWPGNMDGEDYWQYFGNVRLLPSIPLKEATDYSNYQPGGNVVDLKKERVYLERRPPMVIIEIPGKPGKFADLAKLGRGGHIEVIVEDDVRDWAAVIRTPKDGHSITVDCTRAPQHTIAYGDFKLLPEDELVHGHWEWQKMQATVCFSDDRFCEARWPEQDEKEKEDGALRGLDFVRVLRIPCGANYRLDYVAGETIIDLDPDGDPIRVSADATLRDDRDKLKNIARSAYGWYSQTRRAIRMRLPWHDFMGQVRLGQFVTSLEAGSYVVGSIISEIEVSAISYEGQEPRNDLPPMQATIHTAYGELDFLRLHAHGARRAKREKRK